ncbi:MULTISPECIES: hypothetical protein [Amycolatopsis]|uniref:hypothetical protein n=1 Tax=Amycolatopsis TaxID=1813 RepID=UPI000B8790B7|nr:hypothetical protein [Amycolatopsis sacchari]
MTTTVATTGEPTPSPSSASATTSKPKPSSSKQKTSTPRRSTRPAPQYGYQCRDGDEKLYSVCAGHKQWVEGQLEYTNCLDSGGTWDIDAQRCVRPSATTLRSSP